MLLLLLRHAEARPGYTDELRALTGHGRAQAATMAALLARHDAFGAARALHSTLVRARETAEAVQGALPRPLPLEEVPGLAPDDPIAPWIERLGRSPEPVVLLVGHNPHLTLLAAALLGAGSRRPPLEIPKAGLVGLRRLAPAPGPGYPGAWNLEWLVPPELAG